MASIREVSSSPASAVVNSPPAAMEGLLEGATSSGSGVSPQAPKKQICCACPNTRKLRDECVIEHGDEACGKWIDAHKMCLRAEGFKV